MSIFGGNTGTSYEELQRRKRMAQQLQQSLTRTPRNAGEGIHALAKAFVALRMEKDNRSHEAELRKQFQDQFSELAPNKQGLIDLANSPYAGKAHQSVIQALLKGVPNYKNGVKNAPGGLAVVGEDGPEVIELPAGSNVNPSDLAFFDYLEEAIQNAPQDTPSQPTPSQSIPVESLQGPSLQNDQSSFNDAGAFNVAELDAQKFLSLQPEYGDVASGDVGATEAKMIAYLRRAMFANAAMEDPRLAESMTKMDNAVAGKMGALGRLYTNSDYELGRLAAEQFASAILRRDSGAATPDPEVARYVRQYFPLANETQAELDAKSALRREEIRALQQSLASEDTAGIVAQIEQEIADLKSQAQRDNGQGISAEDKEFLKSLGLE